MHEWMDGSMNEYQWMEEAFGAFDQWVEKAFGGFDAEALDARWGAT